MERRESKARASNAMSVKPRSAMRQMRALSVGEDTVGARASALQDGDVARRGRF